MEGGMQRIRYIRAEGMFIGGIVRVEERREQ